MSESSGTSDLPSSNPARDLSMEDILASIRKILSEEQVSSRFIQESEDELLLDNSMLLSVRCAPVSKPNVNVVFSLPKNPVSSELEQKHEEVEQAQYFKGFVEQPDVKLAPELVRDLPQHFEADREVAIGRPGITLEDLVREALEPMLKAWLDRNLPTLVERVVLTKTNHS